MTVSPEFKLPRPSKLSAFVGGVFLFLASGPAAIAGSASNSASATISGTGGVGETPTDPPPTTTPTPTPPANDTGTSSALPTEDGGGVTDPTESVEVAGESTFRPAPQAEAPPEESASPGGDSPATNPETAETRLPQGTQSVGNLLGGSSAVGVAGDSNQTFTVGLPGKTVYSGSGGNVVSIDGFVHNAGFTPALNSAGSGVFVMGAQVSSAGAGGGAGTAGAATGGTAAGTTASGEATGGTVETGASTTTGDQTGGDTGTTTAAADQAGGDSGGGTSGEGGTTEGGEQTAEGGYNGPVIASSPFVTINIFFN